MVIFQVFFLGGMDPKGGCSCFFRSRKKDLRNRHFLDGGMGGKPTRDGMEQANAAGLARYVAFLKWGTPTIAGWFVMEHPLRMDDDWGYPPFQETFIYTYKIL